MLTCPGVMGWKSRTSRPSEEYRRRVTDCSENWAAGKRSRAHAGSPTRDQPLRKRSVCHQLGDFFVAQANDFGQDVESVGAALANTFVNRRPRAIEARWKAVEAVFAPWRSLSLTEKLTSGELR